MQIIKNKENLNSQNQHHIIKKVKNAHLKCVSYLNLITILRIN
jgi:hypothetical protein